jgi:hypothetical protein
MSTATIKSENGILAFYSPYDQTLIDCLKQMIPPHGRQWDKANRRWLVEPVYENELETACNRAGFTVNRQAGMPLFTQPKTEQRILRVEYIGAPKEREDGSITAYGFIAGNWSVIFPQDVLKAWFETGVIQEGKPTGVTTFYGLLAIKKSAAPDDIKSAYRKMVRRYHPDVNRDADAPEMMKQINHAYEVLRNPATRRKYDAGLQLEASLERAGLQKPRKQHDDWRPPLRCGFLLVTGTERLGRFVVERIDQWQDIIDGNGYVMVTSWPMGNKVPEVNWI